MTWYTVADIDTTINQFCEYRSICMAPDNKLYIGYFHGLSKQWSVIDNPDLKGVGCNFCRKCLRLDTLSWGYIGVPPCMPNYGLGAKTCWPLVTGNLDSPSSWNLYPVPSSGIIHIEYSINRSKNYEFIVYDLTGHIMYRSELDGHKGGETINLCNCTQGVYLYKVTSSGTKFYGKIIIE